MNPECNLYKEKRSITYEGNDEWTIAHYQHCAVKESQRLEEKLIRRNPRIRLNFVFAHSLDLITSWSPLATDYVLNVSQGAAQLIDGRIFKRSDMMRLWLWDGRPTPLSCVCLLPAHEVSGFALPSTPTMMVTLPQDQPIMDWNVPNYEPKQPFSF